jgi:hypothetical protein
MQKCKFPASAEVLASVDPTVQKGRRMLETTGTPVDVGTYEPYRLPHTRNLNMLYGSSGMEQGSHPRRLLQGDLNIFNLDLRSFRFVCTTQL